MTYREKCDAVLTALQDGQSAFYTSISYKTGLNDDEVFTIIDTLVSEGYARKPEKAVYRITGAGLEFIQAGGYSVADRAKSARKAKEEEKFEIDLFNAKRTKRISIWAFIISVLAIVISLITCALKLAGI